MKNTYLIFIFLFFGLSLIAGFIYFSQKPISQLSSGHLYAQIIDTVGSSQLFRKNARQPITLQTHNAIYYLDTIQTTSNAIVTLEFPSAHRIRILENSTITIDGKPDRVILIIKKGDIQVDNFGSENGLWIQKQTLEVSATDYELSFKNKNSLPNIENEVSKNTTDNSPLTEEYIQNTLKAYRNHFYKCYNILLEKTPGIKGESTISFKIDNAGKIKNITYTRNTFKDIPFQKCLEDALTRIPFRSYTGNTISTLLPLKFE